MRAAEQAGSRAPIRASVLVRGELTSTVVESGRGVRSAEERVFMYMPYMHSESKVIHEVAERLFKQCGPKSNYDFELRHKVIIDRFGRYPHRNAMLGRQSTAEELEFLAQPGSSF
jgi:uncharacterized protein (DUF924 family)